MVASLIGIKDLESALAPNMAEIENLIAAYDRHLIQEENNTRKPGIHASEISRCYRQAVYTMRGEEKKQEGNAQERIRWKRTFELGHAIHGMLQTHFKTMAEGSGLKLQFAAEVPIHPNKQELAAKWNIHSSCDGVFTFQYRDPTTWNYVPYIRMGLEIKSSNANQFEKLQEPKPEHIEQTCVYMAVLDLPVMWILYFNKDNQNITPSTAPWLVKFDPKLWARLESRFAKWHEHLAAGTLPDPMPGIHCNFCPYAWTCLPKKSSYRFSGKPTSAGLRKLT